MILVLVMHNHIDSQYPNLSNDNAHLKYTTYHVSIFTHWFTDTLCIPCSGHVLVTLMMIPQELIDELRLSGKLSHQLQHISDTRKQ